MAAPVRTCGSCQTSLPDGALYCPTCGAATPTAISGDTGTLNKSPATISDDAEQHRRVQRALGAGFQLGRLLGRGGFAEVYAATDVQLKRPVAVKVLRGDLLGSARLAERFRREAEAVARLRHPNIVAIYQVGEAEGLAYYIMPLIEGGSLREKLEHGPLSLAEASRILREVAGALAVAHRAGIIHRDIKPDNIMLEGDEGRAVLMDFGIAKAMASEETGLTGTGMIVGTPHYMSPEQAMGSKDIGAPSDVYSLGVVAYQMLSGRLPFEGSTPQELLVRHIAGKPTPLERLRPDAPDELVDAVNRCLAKEPSQRWGSADELVAALRPIPPATVQGTSGSARGRTFRVAGRRVRVRRWQVLAAVLAVLVTYVGLTPNLRAWLVSAWKDLVAHYGPPSTVSTALSRSWWWDRNGFRIFAVGDTSLGVLSRYREGYSLALWNTRSWSRVRVPNEQFGETVAAVADTVLFFAGQSWWNSPRSERALVGGRFTELDTFPRGTEVVWSDGHDAVIATIAGEVLWRTPSGWQLKPTGREAHISNLFGTSREALVAVSNFFGDSSGTDSLLRFRGISWQALDPRPDTSKRWGIRAVTATPDHALAVVGTECDTRTARCAPLVAVAESLGARWQALGGRLPSDWRPTGVLGTTRGRVLVWGLWGPSVQEWEFRDCRAQETCLWQIDSVSATPISDAHGLAVAGAVLLGGRPYVLMTNGLIWTEVQGAWGVATQVPEAATLSADWDSTGLGTLEHTASYAAAGDGWLEGEYVGPQGSVESLPYPFDHPVRFVRARARNGLLAFLSSEGQIALYDCRRIRGSRGVPTILSPPPGMRVRDIAILRPDTLVAVGDRGVVAVRSAKGWTTTVVDSSEDLVEVYAHDSLPLAVLGEHSVRLRQAGGRWSSAMPRYFSEARHLAVLADTTIVVAGTRFFTAFRADLPDHRLYSCEESETRTITAIAVLPAGRIAVTSAPQRDPLLGGGVQLAPPSSSAGRGGRGAECESLEVPRATAVYGAHWARQSIHVPTRIGGAAMQSVGLEAFGSGGRRLYWPIGGYLNKPLVPRTAQKAR